jgi:hypothetical protein
VNDSTVLTSLLLAKVEQQVELTVKLVARVPVERLEWRPAPGAFQLSHLLGHLLEASAGFCAALYRARPQQLAHFARLRDLPVNHACDPRQAAERLRDYLNHIREGFAALTDGDLSRRLPTVFNPAGEALLTILLTNLEHFLNHKYQLFFYLKLLGVEVGTAQLYEISPPPASSEG